MVALAAPPGTPPLTSSLAELVAFGVAPAAAGVAVGGTAGMAVPATVASAGRVAVPTGDADVEVGAALPPPPQALNASPTDIPISDNVTTRIGALLRRPTPRGSVRGQACHPVYARADEINMKQQTRNAKAPKRYQWP